MNSLTQSTNTCTTQNGESGSVKQSSRYVTHGLYRGDAHWQHIMNTCMGHDVAYTKMAWTDEALSP